MEDNNSKNRLKRMKPAGIAVCLYLITAAALTGCGGSSGSAYIAETAASAVNTDGPAGGLKMMAPSSADAAAGEVAEYEEAADLDGGSSGGSSAVSEEELTAAEAGESTERKLIKNVDISLQTTSFDTLLEDITEKVSELGGYIESSNSYNAGYYDNSTRSANYTVRVPADKLDEFLDTALTAGKITNKTVTTEDITLKYSDLESRVNALQTEQERLLELIAEAEDVDAVIALETRLSEIRYELNSIQSSLKIYDNQVTYSTVYIYIDEVAVVSSTPDSTFTERVASGFKQNLLDLCASLENALIAVIVNLPAIIIAAVIILICAFPVRKAVMKRISGKKAKQEKEDDGEKGE